MPQQGQARLAEQDEAAERGAVDPVQAAQDGERGQAPPGVAHVLHLLRPPAQPAAARLPLAQPAHGYCRQPKGAEMPCHFDDSPDLD